MRFGTFKTIYIHSEVGALLGDVWQCIDTMLVTIDTLLLHTSPLRYVSVFACLQTNMYIDQKIIQKEVF